MSSRVRLAYASIMALLGVAACGTDSDTPASETRPGVLYFLNWESEIAPDTIADFERRTGIRVEVDYIVSNVTLQTRILTGNSGIDVAVPSSNFLQPLIQAGALRKLDRSKLPNWRHLDPRILQRLERFDPGNQYAVPYLLGTEGIAYNVRAVREALGRDPEPSWNLIFDPEHARRLASCGIVWQDAAGSFMTDYALIAMGRDPSVDRLEDLPAVEEMFRRTRPYVRYLETGLRLREDLASGEVCIVIGASGFMMQARELATQTGSGVDVRYVVPNEGAVLWIDLLVIPADARHVESAHRLIDFLMEPRIIADITNATRFANANLAATELVDPELREDPSIYFSPEVMARLHLVPAESLEYARERTRMWTRVRTSK